jgi:predicted nucleotide-binding protein
LDTFVAKTLLFLGSSSAAKSQAKALLASLTSEQVEFLPWWDAFPAGRTLLEQLDSIRAKVQGAVLVFAPEAEGTVRGKTVQMPNLNVLFEFGYFYGHFGRERVAMIKYSDFYLPTDLGGYIHVAGSKSFRRGGIVKVGKRTKSEFVKWVDAAGFAVKKLEPAAAQSGGEGDNLRRRVIRSRPFGPGSWMA